MIYEITLATKRMNGKANIARNAVRGYGKVDHSVLSRVKWILMRGVESDCLHCAVFKLGFGGGRHGVLN